MTRIEAIVTGAAVAMCVACTSAAFAEINNPTWAIAAALSLLAAAVAVK